MRQLPAVAFAAFLAACASRSVPPGPEPVPDQTLQVWREELQDNSNSVLLWARNDGDRPVVVTEVRLYGCTNLFQECTTVHPNVRIEPGATARVLRLDPSNHGKRPSFGWEYRWQGVRAARVTSEVEMPGRTVIRSTSVADLRMVDVEQLRPLVAADDRDGRCTTAPPVNGPAGFRALAMRFGTGPGTPHSRLVHVTLDAAGAPLMYADSRGDMRMPPPGIEPRQPITDPGPRTDISVDVVHGAAIVINRQADGAVDRMMASGDQLLDAASLGTPSTVIARIIRECGGR